MYKAELGYIHTHAHAHAHARTHTHTHTHTHTDTHTHTHTKWLENKCVISNNLKLFSVLELGVYSMSWLLNIEF